MEFSFVFLVNLLCWLCSDVTFQFSNLSLPSYVHHIHNSRLVLIKSTWTCFFPKWSPRAAESLSISQYIDSECLNCTGSFLRMKKWPACPMYVGTSWISHSSWGVELLERCMKALLATFALMPQAPSSVLSRLAMDGWLRFAVNGWVSGYSSEWMSVRFTVKGWVSGCSSDGCLRFTVKGWVSGCSSEWMSVTFAVNGWVSGYSSEWMSVRFTVKRWMSGYGSDGWLWDLQWRGGCLGMAVNGCLWDLQWRGGCLGTAVNGCLWDL